ncbi:MAG: hypothetical protein HOF44_06145 [Pelagibacterales bacterium]|mgnify:FL=1|nr:hypothetical protein [Pelagibacterales bacterium]
MKKVELNDKQEIFCQKYALSTNSAESARQSGYAKSSAKVQGFKLLQLPQILERIEELRNDMVTSYDVVQELEDQYAYAKSHGHTNSALKALEMLSKIRGNKVKAKETSPESRHASIVSSFWILGREKVMQLMEEAEALGSQAVTRMMANK